MNSTSLYIELIPKSCWYTNVRSNVTQEEWDKIRKKCYAEANHVCEICGANGHEQGFKHRVECHEIWEFNEKDYTQKLTGLISLCPYCHKSKHYGFARISGNEHIVREHIMFVNGWSEEELDEHIDESFDVWMRRSKCDWHLDIKYLDEYLMDDNDKFLSMFDG